MNFLNLVLIFEITKRSENLNIFMGSVIIGSFFALFVFGFFLFSFKMLRVPQKHWFRALLAGTNMVVVVTLYNQLRSFTNNDWNDWAVIFSALSALNIFIFVFKRKYLDK